MTLRFTWTNQTRVAVWVLETFGPKSAADVPERALRAVEEVVELAQAVGIEAATLHRLVDYVFSRPVGKAPQEIASSLVTLYSTATALGVDAEAEFEKEMARVQTPEVVERCRRRQQEKREALMTSLEEEERA